VRHPLISKHNSDIIHYVLSGVADLTETAVIRISKTRHAQLQQLRAHLGVKSAAAIVERLIVEEMRRCDLPDDKTFAVDGISGIAVLPHTLETDQVVFFGIGNEPPAYFSLAEAEQVAAALDRASVKGGGRWRLDRTHRGNANVVIARRGRGVIIEVNGFLIAIRDGIAVSLAAAIREAIEAAKLLEDGAPPPPPSDEPKGKRTTELLNAARPSDRGSVDPAKIRVPR
jgi:hypothetical protein